MGLANYLLVAYRSRLTPLYRFSSGWDRPPGACLRPLRFLTQLPGFACFKSILS